jgi:hypothetical protein
LEVGVFHKVELDCEFGDGDRACSTLDVLVFVATILGALLQMTVLRPSPREAVRQFHHQVGIAEDQLICPLVLAGPRACPAILADVKKRHGVRFGYAIAALGSLHCSNAAPYLQELMRNEKEADSLRSDALEALWQIEEWPPEDYARTLAERQDTLGMVARRVLKGGWPIAMSPWQAVWCPHE